MLEVGWWGWGVIKGSFQKHLKTGAKAKAKVVHRGGDFEGVTPLLPENFNRTQGRSGRTVSASPVKRLLQQLVYSHTGVKFGKGHSIYFRYPIQKSVYENIVLGFLI